jgi:hypothetical protein
MISVPTVKRDRLRDASALATALAVGVCVWVAARPYPPSTLRSVVAVAAFSMLLLLASASALRRNFRLATVQACLLAGSVMLLQHGWAVIDGSAEVVVRLAIVGAGAHDEPRVYWSGPLDGGGWGDSPWEQLGADSAEFSSTSRLHTTESVGRFSYAVHWWFRPNHLIVVAIGERRFRFEAGFIFGEHGSGAPPRELSATLDIGGYLSGAKEPPPLEWPPDQPGPDQGRAVPHVAVADR